MKTRIATTEDVEALYQLWMELLSYHRSHHDLFVIKEDAKTLVTNSLTKRLQDPQTQIFVAYTKDGTITGLMIANHQEISEAFMLHHKGYIGETIIAQHYRGLEIGKLLFESAKNWLKEQGVDHITAQVTVDNVGAKRFWNSLGFVTTTHMLVKKL